MADQTIDAIKVRLGVDASDVEPGVQRANKALNALGGAKRVVDVTLSPKWDAAQIGKAEGRLTSWKKGIKVPLDVEIKQGGQFSIASVRRKINEGLKAGGGVDIPVRIDLNKNEAAHIRSEIRRQVGVVKIDFEWTAKGPPTYDGPPIKVPWEYGEGPGGAPPPTGPQRPTPPSTPPSPTAGPSGASSAYHPGKQPGETKAQATARHKAEHEADEAARRAAREDQKASEGKQQQAKKEQEAQRTARSQGATSTTPGSIGDATRRAQRDAERAQQNAAKATKDAADRTVRTARQQSLDTEAAQLRQRRKDIEAQRPSKSRENKLVHQQELGTDLNRRRREAAKEARAARPAAPEPVKPASGRPTVEDYIRQAQANESAAKAAPTPAAGPLGGAGTRPPKPKTPKPAAGAPASGGTATGTAATSVPSAGPARLPFDGATSLDSMRGGKKVKGRGSMRMSAGGVPRGFGPEGEDLPGEEGPEGARIRANRLARTRRELEAAAQASHAAELRKSVDPRIGAEMWDTGELDEMIEGAQQIFGETNPARKATLISDFRLRHSGHGGMLSTGDVVQLDPKKVKRNRKIARRINRVGGSSDTEFIAQAMGGSASLKSLMAASGGQFANRTGADSGGGVRLDPERREKGVTALKKVPKTSGAKGTPTVKPLIERPPDEQAAFHAESKAMAASRPANPRQAMVDEYLVENDPPKPQPKIDPLAGVSPLKTIGRKPKAGTFSDASTPEAIAAGKASYKASREAEARLRNASLKEERPSAQAEAELTKLIKGSIGASSVGDPRFRTAIDAFRGQYGSLSVEDQLKTARGIYKPFTPVAATPEVIKPKRAPRRPKNAPIDMDEAAAKLAGLGRVSRLAEGGVMYAADGIYSRKIGHDFGGEKRRSLASQNSTDWKKIRSAHLRSNPFCKHCGIGKLEAKDLGVRLTVDAIQSEAHGGSHTDPTNLQTLCSSCNSRKSGFSHQPDELWDHARPRGAARHPAVGKTTAADWMAGGRLFGISTLLQAKKAVRIKKRAEGGEDPAGAGLGADDKAKAERLDRMFGDKPGMWWNKQTRQYHYDHERETKEQYEQRNTEEANGARGDWSSGRGRGPTYEDLHGQWQPSMCPCGHDRAKHSMFGGSACDACSCKAFGSGAKHGSTGDDRSKIDKLKAMADQSASPNEADVAKRMLRKRGVEGYADGGAWVKHGGLLERMAQAGHEPSVTIVGERGREGIVTDPNTGQSEVVPTHKLPTWLARAREGKGLAKDLTGRAGGGAAPFGRLINPIGGGNRGTNAQRMSRASSNALAAGIATPSADVTRVAVVNWPSMLTHAAVGAPAGFAQGPFQQQQPQPMPGVQPNLQGAVKQNQQQRPQGAQQQGAQQASGKVPPLSYRQKGGAKAGAAESAESQQERVGHIRAGISEQLSYSPVRAFSVVMGQIFAQALGGRAGIQSRANLATVHASAAGRAVSKHETAQQQVLENAEQIANLNKLKKANNGLTADEVEEGKKLLATRKDLLAARGDAASIAEKKLVRAEESKGAISTKADKARSVVTGLAGVTAGTIAFSAVFNLVNEALQGAVPQIEKWVDSVAGFTGTNQAITKTMGASLRQSGGNLTGIVGDIGMQTGMSDSLMRAIEGDLGSSAFAKSGAAARGEKTDYLKSLANSSAPTGLIGGYGGLGGGPFLAEMMGGGKGYAEQVGLLTKDLGEKATPQKPDFIGGIVRATYDQGALKTMDAEKAAANSKALGALNETVTDLNDSMKRGAEAVGEAGYQFERVGKEQAEASGWAKDLGNEAKDMAAGGLILKNAAGDLVTTQKEYQTAISQGARGDTMMTPEAAMRKMTGSQGYMGVIETQLRANKRQQQFTTDEVIPAETAFQYAQKPLIGYNDPRLRPNQNMLPKQGKGYQQQAGAYDAAFKKYESAALPAQQAITAEIEKGNKVLESWGVPQSMISDLSGVGKSIQNIQLGIEQRGLNLTVASFNNELRIAKRSLQDAKDLQAGIKGEVRETVGGLEGQNIALGRQLQLLEQELAQRQINFKLAMAGFTAPGDTPEQRQARIDQAKLEAKYAQEQLDIQKKMSSNQFKSTGMQAGRSVTDLQAQISLLTQGRALTIDTAAAQKAIEALSGQEDILTKKVAARIEEGQKSKQLGIQAINDMEAATGKAIKTLTPEFINAFGKAGVAMGEQIQKYLMPETYGLDGGSAKTVAPTTAAGRRETEDNVDYNKNGVIGAASGFAGMTKGLTNFTAGEVNNEAVIVLKNPTSLPMGGLGGGGGGGGIVNVNINIAGGGDIDERKLAAWGRQIQQQTIAALNRQTSLLGLRTP